MNAFNHPQSEKNSPTLLAKALAPRRYLTVCFFFFSAMAIVRFISGFPFWICIRQIGIFLILLVGIAYNMRLARKVMAILHVYYSIPGFFALIALIYHAGSMDILGYKLATLPSAILAILCNGYCFLGAIRLWRVKGAIF